jgi:peptide/nickel transport system ATP-binding protein
MRCLIRGSERRGTLCKMALLDVRNLTIGYDTRDGYLKAVDRASFTLEEGKSLGFVGESGCGKTTIGMALMALLPPNGSVAEGEIFFQGKNLLTMAEDELRQIRWQKIAMIFQAAMNALNPVHRVNNQIAEAILAHEPALGKEVAMKQVAGLFQLVGIPKDRWKDYPHQYSGGMKQRAMIAMALACRPKLIIADEPTTALDVIVQDQILEETKKLQREFNIGMIFISHDISIVSEVCDDIIIMYAGQLVEYGPREEVFDSPIHPYTKALLSSYPTLTGKKSYLTPIPGETPNLIDFSLGCRFCDRCPGAKASCKIGSPAWVKVSSRHKALCYHCG